MAPSGTSRGARAARPAQPWLPPTITVAAELSGRFPITEVQPCVLGGRRPAAAAVGEAVPIRCVSFREGHDALGVQVRLLRPDGSEHSSMRLAPCNDGLDTWQGQVRPDAQGLWSFEILAWGDPWASWRHRAEIKVPAGIDADLELEEGALVLERAAASLGAAERVDLATAVAALRSTLPPADRLAAALAPAVVAIMHEQPLREHVTVSGPWPLRVQRRRALVGAWYELFPRSEGADPAHAMSGTLATAAERLPAIAAMGFDVVYVPPVHPIGEVNRKGPNNTLTPAIGDPGSPWAIGSAAGGHDAVHPDLGTLADFDDFVAQCTGLGMEIALDLALQAAPDHPWVASHPEWFTTRADGTIAYAENPPKKYQDIYPLNFDNDPEGLYLEVERIVRFWVGHGVQIFRVDNPHTKPVWVWERLIAAINADHPDVIFLAEAFTGPPMMRALAQVGFQQSYTYFTWRNSRDELEQYLTELAGPLAASMRPNLFTNTPDILTAYLQNGGPHAFAIRATLAATLSPTYGIYSGFELFEHVALRPGSEEYLDTEKFQYRPRDWAGADASGVTLAPLLTRLNAIRAAHPALQDLRSLRFHACDNPSIIAFSKADDDDCVLVVCTLDPYNEQQGTVHLDMGALGLQWDDQFTAHDLVREQSWTWGQNAYVRLAPWEQVAHVIHVARGDASGS
ncbi:MAG: alpha-1,4-glucan--maltose-1-phosphate maltosyltransferase [Candidatus Nanopelagicales bacterium]|nr:alpha-1,4-glucan--maltose-1-phosphate maltosyltransferase [Candidatus Nanopelagicales bacterium]